MNLGSPQRCSRSYDLLVHVGILPQNKQGFNSYDLLDAGATHSSRFQAMLNLVVLGPDFTSLYAVFPEMKTIAEEIMRQHPEAVDYWVQFFIQGLRLKGERIAELGQQEYGW